jgi:hypothetical protein
VTVRGEHQFTEEDQRLKVQVANQADPPRKAVARLRSDLSGALPEVQAPQAKRMLNEDEIAFLLIEEHEPES